MGIDNYDFVSYTNDMESSKVEKMNHLVNMFNGLTNHEQSAMIQKAQRILIERISIRLERKDISTADALNSFAHIMLLDDIGFPRVESKPANENSDDDAEHEEVQYSSQGYIYFIVAVQSGRIKIGYSIDPQKRIASLSTSSPFDIEMIKVIPGTMEEERRIHDKFDHIRMHGEWFTDCDELREYIAQLSI